MNSTEHQTIINDIYNELDVDRNGADHASPRVRWRNEFLRGLRSGKLVVVTREQFNQLHEDPAIQYAKSVVRSL